MTQYEEINGMRNTTFGGTFDTVEGIQPIVPDTGSRGDSVVDGLS